MTTKKNFPVSSQHGSSESLLKDIRRNTKRIFISEQNRVLLNSVVNIVYPIALTTNGIRNLLRLAKLALMVIPSVKQQVMR